MKLKVTAQMKKASKPGEKDKKYILGCVTGGLEEVEDYLKDKDYDIDEVDAFMENLMIAVKEATEKCLKDF